jgi:hypothetical protein
MEKDKKAELDPITTTVWECLDRFMKVTTKHIETKPSPRKRHADLEALIRSYASAPTLEDVRRGPRLEMNVSVIYNE